jgi:hypothetical protein
LRFSAWKFASQLQQLACKPQIEPATLKADAEDLLRRMFANVGNNMPPIVDAAEFLGVTLPEPKQIVRGLLHQGSKLALGGSSKAFKTWTLLDLALSVAHGHPWLDFPTTKGKVLYVNFEIQDSAWQKRLQDVSIAKGFNIELGCLALLNMRGRAAGYASLLPKIASAAKGRDFALIVLDPVYKLYGGTDENSAGDVAGLLNSVEALAVETGAAVAFGAHFSKGNQAGKESIDRVSGSGVFARDPDSLIVMTKHQTEGAFTVEATLRNFPCVPPFVVEWSFPLMRRVNYDPAKLKQAKGRGKSHNSVDLLDVLPAEGLTNADWCRAAQEKFGMGVRTFYNLKKELHKEGKVTFSKEKQKWQLNCTKPLQELQ